MLPLWFVGMNLLFDFPQSWVILFFAFLLIWAVLFIVRNSKGRREVKEQVYLAVAGLFSLFLMEVFATQSNLWHYIPGDWPVILWPTYVAAILFGYQLLRFIEERLIVKSVDLR
jgi:choline-glycine betaine transporter